MPALHHEPIDWTGPDIYDHQEEPMTNPIPTATRGWLYVLSIVVGVLAVVTGPLLIALDVSSEWSAVVVSAVGAVTTLLGTLARSNLGDVATIETVLVDES